MLRSLVRVPACAWQNAWLLNDSQSLREVPVLGMVRFLRQLHESWSDHACIPGMPGTLPSLCP